MITSLTIGDATKGLNGKTEMVVTHWNFD